MKKYYILLAAIMLNCSASFAKTSCDLKTEVPAAIEKYKEQSFLNATYKFTDNSGTLAFGASGFRSAEEGKEVMLKSDQIMPIASITKMMTAASILKLQERGLLNVHDKISKHLGEKSGIWQDNKMPKWADELEIHHLLTHRSGLPEYFMDAKLDVTKPHDEINKDIANFAASKELSMKPGEKHNYNNTNFVLLGMIIEKVSGQKLGDFYQKELFTPLGMKNTRLLSLEEAIDSQKNPFKGIAPVRYFMTPAGTKRPILTLAEAPFFMIPFSDGGVVSNVEDLIIWHKALHNGKVLSKNSYKLMTTGYYDAPSKTGVKSKVGYGMYISTLENGDVVYHHAGNAYAIRGESGYIPSKKFYYAVLSNMMTYTPEEQKNALDMRKSVNKPDIVYFTRFVYDSVFGKRS